MQVICPLSGEMFSAPHFFAEQTHYPHPIFTLSADKLTKLATTQWAVGKLNEQEGKLLFLALLNKTKVVSWNCYADPSVSVVNSNMERLVKIINWMDLINPGTISFPALRVTEINYQLNNIAVYINEWYDCRTQHVNGTNSRDLQELLETREAKLTMLMRNNIPTGDLASRLASWALDATGVRGDKFSEKRKLWTALFKIKTPDIFSLPAAEFQEVKRDFQELKDFMEHNLLLPGSHANSAGSSFALETLKLLREISSALEGGMYGFLGGLDGLDFQLLDTSSGKEVTVSTVETINRKIISANAPTKEPRKEDFASNFAYLKALAAWNVSVSYREQLAEVAGAAGTTEVSESLATNTKTASEPDFILSNYKEL